MCVCVCGCVCVCVRVRVHVCVCVHTACVWLRYLFLQHFSITGQSDGCCTACTTADIEFVSLASPQSHSQRQDQTVGLITSALSYACKDCCNTCNMH